MRAAGIMTERRWRLLILPGFDNGSCHQSNMFIIIIKDMFQDVKNGYNIHDFLEVIWWIPQRSQNFRSEGDVLILYNT